MSLDQMMTHTAQITWRGMADGPEPTESVTTTATTECRIFHDRFASQKVSDVVYTDYRYTVILPPIIIDETCKITIDAVTYDILAIMRYPGGTSRFVECLVGVKK